MKRGLILLGMFIVFFGISFVSGASEGFNNPGTLTSNNSIGNYAYSNPENASESDDSHAVAGWSNNSGVASIEFLKVTNFGFSIPVGATVNGVNVIVEKATLGIFCTTNIMRLINATDSFDGDDKSSQVQNCFGSGDEELSYGNSTDLWGLELTPDDINDENFGVAFAVNISDGPGSVAKISVDNIRINVSYTPAVADEPPSISLNGPSGEDSDGIVDFSYVVSDSDSASIDYCTIYTAGIERQGEDSRQYTDSSITLDSNQVFTVADAIKSNRLEWFVECYDAEGNSANSSKIVLDTLRGSLSSSGGGGEESQDSGIQGKSESVTTGNSLVDFIRNLIDILIFWK